MPIIPTVIEQTPQGERAYDLFSRLLNDRIIILSGVVDDTTAASVVLQFDAQQLLGNLQVAARRYG